MGGLGNNPGKELPPAGLRSDIYRTHTTAEASGCDEAGKWHEAHTSVAPTSPLPQHGQKGKGEGVPSREGSTAREHTGAAPPTAPRKEEEKKREIPTQTT